MNRRLLEELVFQRLARAVDVDLMLELQADLIRSVARTARPDADPLRLARTARRVLRRAWRRYGDDAVMVLREEQLASLESPSE
jgi:hypothetical protein